MADDTLLLEQLAGEVAQNEFLQERLADLELAIDDIGWERLNWDGSREFTRDFLDRLVALSRLNALKNPLIRRGVRVKTHYVFGQGVDVQARDANVNELVVQPFLDDEGNQAALFGAMAAMDKDRALTVDGNIVLVLFPNQLTGKVSVRSINIDEIRDVIVDPDDNTRNWLYLRRWSEREVDLVAGIDRVRQREAWYPDWRWTPPASQRPESFNRIPIRWESPIYHVTVGGLDGMRFGVPETYAALDWAKAYKLFLEDWATIVRSLSRFAWKAKAKRNPGAMAARLGSTVTRSNPVEGNASPATGSVFVGTEGTDLEAIPKSGATVASEDGVWLAKMVAAALDIPYTVLMGDADMGNLATAKTLDRPTELAMMERQALEAQIRRDLCSYAVDWAARAPGGPLQGTVVLVDGRERIVLADETDRTVDVTFPPILDDDMKATIEAIRLAWETELPPAKVIFGLLLRALGVEDVDELEAEFDEEKWEQRRASAGAAAIAAFRQGQDPAKALGGGDEDDPDGDE